MIKPPSNQREYTAFFSQDPAIVTLPAEATDEQRKELAERIKRARETGNLQDVVVQGESPTLFTFRQLPPGVAGELIAMMQDARSHRELFLVWSLAFRAALVTVRNLPDCGPVDFTTHVTLGQIATLDFLSRAGITGEAGAAVVVDLGSHVMNRTRGPDPKS